MHLERAPEPRHLSNSHGLLEPAVSARSVPCYAESQQLLRRVPNLYHLARLKPLEQSPQEFGNRRALLRRRARTETIAGGWHSTRWKHPRDAAGPREQRRSVPQMRGRRYEKS